MFEPTDSMLAKVRLSANAGHFDGRETAANMAYIRRCTWFHGASGTQFIYTRDTGHHSSGWMKNPDFERCWHFSVSFREPLQWPEDRIMSQDFLLRMGMIFPQAPFDKRLAALWARALLEDMHRYAWVESPKSPEGKHLEVLHYRVFCGPDWQVISPRGEVYSTQHTEPDWRSWSEIHGADAPAPSTLNAE